MITYGICQNAVCTLSYMNPSLDSFRRRVFAAAHAIGQSKADSAPQLADWEQFGEFFQRGAVCSACRKPLYLVTQPTEGTDAEEYKRRVRLNGLLEVARQLQGWGILRG